MSYYGFMSFLPKEFGENLIDYLQTRFHPGKPHVGVLGPKHPDNSEDVSNQDPYFEDEYDVQISPTMGKVVFDYVPNRATYSLTLNDQENIQETSISFFIRIAEGTIEDTKDDNRDKKYILTKENIESSFKKYEVKFYSNPLNLEQRFEIFIDGKKLSDHELSQILKPESNEPSINPNISKLIIEDNSSPFLYQTYGKGGATVKIDEQKYKIEIRKIFKKNNDGEITTQVEVINHSLQQFPSSIPLRRKIKDGGNLRHQTEEECITEIRDQIENKELFDKWEPFMFNLESERWEIHGNSYGFLMEFKMEESKINSSNEPYALKYGQEVERIINTVYDSKISQLNGKFEGSISYKDHLLFREKIPKMVKGSKPSSFFNKLGLNELLGRIMEVDMAYDSFYTFQEESIEKIQNIVKKDEEKAIMISARTGGGKTEAFMVPIINYCIEHNEQNGTKALIFYPRKALANDQAGRIIRFLYNVNKHLTKKLTIGILHGDVSKKSSDEVLGDPDNMGIPLPCPITKCTGSLIPTSNTSVKCNICNEKLDFVLSLTREPIYGKTPDIIVTNPETMQFDLMLKPRHHGIFGREITFCEKCYKTYDAGKRKCSTTGCNGKIQQKIPTPPLFLVFDEVHMFGGSYGINTSHLITRLKNRIKKYAEQFHNNPNHTFRMIGSSATISNADVFSTKFFNLPESQILLIPENLDEKDKFYEEGDTDEQSRYHVFVMPHAYRPISTLSKAVGYLQELALNGTPPIPYAIGNTPLSSPLQILGFVNYLADSTQLIDAVEREFIGYSHNIRIGGHSTDFDHELRGKSEKEFNNGILHILFATPTLEVGVDFRTVNCLFLYGFPFSFNEYIQRIGRGGRKEATLVVTICHPWKPIDHYFYSDAKKKVAEQHKHLEPIPLTRNNPDALIKHLKGAVFDVIASNPLGYEILDELGTLSSKKVFEKNQIVDEVLQLLELSTNDSEFKAELKDFVDDVFTSSEDIVATGSKKSLRELFFEEYSKIHNITNFRDSDATVNVETFWEPME